MSDFESTYPKLKCPPLETNNMRNSCKVHCSLFLMPLIVDNNPSSIGLHCANGIAQSSPIVDPGTLILESTHLGIPRKKPTVLHRK